MAQTKSISIPRRNRSGLITFDVYCSITAGSQKADLIDGVIYLSPPDYTDTNELFGWLVRLLYDFCEHHDLGKLYGPRIAFKLDEKNSPEPDIAVVLKKHLRRVERGYVLGPADLAIEIVSPESVERDYEKKRNLYEKFKFPEYWIIDQELQKVTLLQLGARGYKEVRPRKGVLASKVLPGFWLRPEWTWQQPRRRKADVLAEILAGVPR